MLKKFIQSALLLVVLCTTATTYAQVSQAPDGIQFQALATDANGHPAAGRVIYVKDAIVAKTATGTIVYSETFKVTASSAGIFTIVLGKGTYASGVSSIANIDWANGPFFLNLKIAVEPTIPNAGWNANNEYVDLGTSQFWSVPYALYAGNVKGADGKLNTSDTAAMLKPYFTSINLKANIESPNFTGTVSGITKAMVGLGNVDNTADINKPVSTATQTALDVKANATDVNTALVLKANAADVTTALDLKVDKVTGKALSTNDYTTAEKTKLAAITGTNTGDQDLSALAVAADVTTALALKANTSDVNAALALKANAVSVANSINTINTTLNTKANTTDVNNALIAKADVVAVNNAVAALNASLVNKADNAVVTNQLGTKEDKLNKSVNVTTDAASDIKFPSVKAVKTYVDAQVAGATIADASATEKGKIQLAGDLAGTAAAPTVPGLALKENSANKSTNVSTDGASDSKYPSVKAVKSYVDAQLAAGVTSVTIADADASTKGKIQLTGDLGGTAAAPTVPGLALKANATDVVLLTSVVNSNTASITANIAAINLKAPLASPTFTGTLTAPIYATTPQLLTSGSTITWNPTQGLNASVTLDQNSTLSFSATPPSGSSGTLVLTQDVTGGRTITLPSTTNKVLGSTSTTSIALSEASGATDILNFYYDGTNCFWNIGQGYGINGTTNLSSSVSGKLPVANGGTGANTLTGIVKGNGTSAFTAAIAGTDYQAPITLTTTGTGSATLSGTTLNIPLVSSTVNTSTLSGTVALANGGTGQTTIAGIKSILDLAGTKVAIGATSGVTSHGSGAVAVGSGSGNSNQGNNSIAIGYVAGQSSQGANSVAIGDVAGQSGQGANSVAIGSNTKTAANSVAIGNYATTVTYTNSTALGNGATSTANNTIQLGNSTITNVSSYGTITAGTVTYPNTHAGASGQVLTSLGSGTLGWTTPSSSSIADAGTLTGTTLKSTVTASSLTSVGTLTSATVNGKIIAGASSEASPSAVLEASSTTKGFLPPRMTGAQRNLIASPATGLMVYCTNCGLAGGEPQYYNGTAWVNMIGGTASSIKPPAIGDAYEGGIIAYIFGSLDPGYVTGEIHGLIAATSDQTPLITNDGSKWQVTQVRVNSTLSALGKGKINTDAIIVSQGIAALNGYAAGLARSYTGGGYNDWFLPSKDELNKLYLNKAVIGGFRDTMWYFSSTEHPTNSFEAYQQYWGDGWMSAESKNGGNKVRAIRYF